MAEAALNLFAPTIPEVEEIPWPVNVDHLSSTAFKTFAACPEQYRRRYLLGEIIAPNVNLIWGRADHQAAEVNYKQKVDTGVDLPTEDVRQAFASAIDEEIDENGGIGELDWTSSKFQGIGVSGRKREIADMRDRGAQLAAGYHADVAPRIQPIAVEQTFEIHPAWSPVPITGRLDLVAGPTAEYAEQQERLGALSAAEAFTLQPRLIDRKTAGAKKSSPEADWSVQAGIYQLARWLPHEWHVGVKTKTPYNIADEPGLLVKASATRKRWIEKMLRSLLAELGWCYLTFGADEPWPATRALFHQWRCDYCGYRADCSWWKAS